MPKERVASCVLARRESARCDVERLVPARGLQRAVHAHQRFRQPTTVLANSDHLLSIVGNVTNRRSMYPLVQLLRTIV